jgi:hypothetical protein
MTVVTFEDYTPAPRYDAEPWVSARIEEAVANVGPWTILETVPLIPADTDPAAPKTRAFTTELATLAIGWYRITWLDADGNTQPTLPILNVPAPAWQPRPSEVATVVSAWAAQHVGGYENAGRELQHFTDATDPTLARVEGFIGQAVNEIVGRVGVTVLPESLWGLARTAAIWHAAGSVAAKRVPTAADEQSGMYRSFMSNYTASLKDLNAAYRRTLGYRLA